uniref:Lon proteolytic domain-containing protein n=1 Tax=Globodera pallida TaxID=36090 RepID=A0A183BTM8_GLOPA
MKFVLCIPPHDELFDGLSATAAAVVGILSVASGRRVLAKCTITGDVGESGRIRMVGAIAFIGMVSVATGRQVQATHAVTGNVGESGRLKKIGGLQAKTEAAIAAGKSDICMPFGNRQEWHQIDNLIRIEIRRHKAGTSDAVTRQQKSPRTKVEAGRPLWCRSQNKGRNGGDEKVTGRHAQRRL